MHADLERLIRLQQTDTFIENARRRIANHPSLVIALDTRLADATRALEEARKRVDDDKAGRRVVEKDLSMVQTRLGKYKDQLMEVKTNREYQAMQKEIEAAQHEVRQLEDRILEHMLAADDLTAGVKAAEAKLASDTGLIADERRRLEVETAKLEVDLERAVAARADIVSGLAPAALSTYETVYRGRKSVAVVAAKDGFCSACHVRVRPQMYNELHRNDTIYQCASCQRILYYVPAADATDSGVTQ
ncbi:MAG TPA: C4-type zinc ribbon domain-containing protein [Vicinamibacterales bacterium]|jgi:hypothetical protein